MISHNPILNSPYLEPKLHYDTESEGNLDYNNVVEGRRVFKPDSAVIPARQARKKYLNGMMMQQNMELTTLTFAEKKLRNGEPRNIPTQRG